MQDSSDYATEFKAPDDDLVLVPWLGQWLRPAHHAVTLEPVLLRTLSGDTYSVAGWFSARERPPELKWLGRGVEDDHDWLNFKELAASQHPEVLGNLGAWKVLWDPADEIPVDVLDETTALRLCRGDLDPTAVILVWVDAEDAGER